MNKGDLEKLSEIINYYSCNDKHKREQSETELKELRKNNMGLLCLGLLELSIYSNYPEINKITCLVLLRKIIEIDSKNYWGNINKKIKENIKQKSIDILLNYSNNITYDNINKMAFVIEQLVHCVEDFDEQWPELIDLTNSLLKLSLPQDINKIYAIIKTIKYCLSFLSNEILFHIFQFNQFFINIFQANSSNNLKFLELKVISCNFYSELIKYSLNNNLYDISSSNEFISSNMINTLKECLSYLNEEKNNEENNIDNLINLISDVLQSIEILTSPEIFCNFPNEYKELCLILNSIIKLPSYKCQKIIEQSFQRLLDIYLIDIYSFEQKEMVIKKYLDELFNYAYNNICINYNNTNDFSFVLDNYSDYELVPKIYYDVLIFVFDITSQMIQDNEKYIDIFQELEINLLKNNNNIFKYIGLLLLPQIIESTNDFNKVEIYINTCLNNLNNEEYQIRYAASYSINYYILNFGNNFNLKYSLEFIQLIIKNIGKEQNFHTKCEMISVLNCFISHLDDEDNDTSTKTISNNSNAIINAKEYLFNNINDFLKFFISELDIIMNNGKDSEKNLIKNELLKSLLFCAQLYTDKCKPYSNEIIIYLSKYLENIYNKKINNNLYVNILYVISDFGKYSIENMIKNITLFINCLKEIIKNIKNNINQINNINPIINNILPIINTNKPESITIIMNELIELLNSFINDINENDINHIDDLHNILNIINSSIEIIDEKSINYLTQIETNIEKIIKKQKNISKLNNIISDLLSNIIQILSKIKNNKNLKNKGKYYLDIIFNIIKQEYNSSTTLSLVDNLNKIFENIVHILNQNELEQVFNGTIQLIELFESKISSLYYKKNKTENEIEMEKDDDISLSSDDDDSEKEIVEILDDNIENLEQVNENLSLIIENMMKYSTNKKLKNISECLYNKIIPSLLNENISINSNNYNLNNSNNIKIAINLVDDLIEYLDFNKFSSHIIDNLINILIKYSKYNKPDVRQAANYGLGIFIKLSDENIYKKYYIEILKALKISCINFPSNNCQNKKLYRAIGLAYENAIAAIGKAIGYKKMKEMEYFYLWLDNLPLNVDETEMKEGHNILCDFLLNNIYKEYNLGEKYLNKIMKILIKIYKEENLSNEEINDKIKIIFNKKNELRPIIEKIFIEYKNDNNVNKNKIEILINLNK